MTAASPEEAYSQAMKYVRPHEQLLWAGRPDPGVWFTGSDAVAVPFAILWTAFAVFWEAMTFRMGAPGLFRIWGIPFVAIGLYMIVGRFFVRNRRKRRTLYAVTDERAIVAVGPNDVRDIPLAGRPTSTRRSRNGRHVTVRIGSPGRRPNQMQIGSEYGNQYNSQYDGDGVWLEDVADPDRLQAALDRALSRPSR